MLDLLLSMLDVEIASVRGLDFRWVLVMMVMALGMKILDRRKYRLSGIEKVNRGGIDLGSWPVLFLDHASPGTGKVDWVMNRVRVGNEGFGRQSAVGLLAPLICACEMCWLSAVLLHVATRGGLHRTGCPDHHSLIAAGLTNLVQEWWELMAAVDQMLVASLIDAVGWTRREEQSHPHRFQG